MTAAAYSDPSMLLQSADATKEARELMVDRAARTSVACSTGDAPDREWAAARASVQTFRDAQRGKLARGTRGPCAKRAAAERGDAGACAGPMQRTSCDARDVPAATWLQGVQTIPEALAEIMQTSNLRPPEGGTRGRFCSHKVAHAYAEANMPQELMWEGFMGSGRVSVVGPDRQTRVARRFAWQSYHVTVADGKVVGRVTTLPTLEAGEKVVTVSSGTVDDAPMLQVARDLAVLLCMSLGVRLKDACVHVMTVDILQQGLGTIADHGWEFKSGVDVLLPLFMAASLQIGCGGQGAEGDPYNVAAKAAAKLLQALRGTQMTQPLWGAYQKAVACSILRQQGPGPDGRMEFQGHRYDMCLKEACRGHKVRSCARLAWVNVSHG